MPEKDSLPVKDVLKSRADQIGETIKSNSKRIETLKETYTDLQLRYWKDPHPKRHEHLGEILAKIDAILKQQSELIADREKLVDLMRDELKEMEDRYKDVLARTYDFQKHVTTLSTASIVGIAAFVRLFDSSPDFRPAVTVALVCFVVAIVLSVFSMLGDIVGITAIGSRREGM